MCIENVSGPNFGFDQLGQQNVFDIVNCHCIIECRQYQRLAIGTDFQHFIITIEISTKGIGYFDQVARLPAFIGKAAEIGSSTAGNRQISTVIAEVQRTREQLYWSQTTDGLVIVCSDDLARVANAVVVTIDPSDIRQTIGQNRHSHVFSRGHRQPQIVGVCTINGAWYQYRITAGLKHHRTGGVIVDHFDIQQSSART